MVIFGLSHPRVVVVEPLYGNEALSCQMLMRMLLERELEILSDVTEVLECALKLLIDPTTNPREEPAPSVCEFRKILLPHFGVPIAEDPAIPLIPFVEPYSSLPLLHDLGLSKHTRVVLALLWGPHLVDGTFVLVLHLDHSGHVERRIWIVDS
jgi:hypothetical protein